MPLPDLLMTKLRLEQHFRDEFHDAGGEDVQNQGHRVADQQDREVIEATSPRPVRRRRPNVRFSAEEYDLSSVRTSSRKQIRRTF